MRENLSEIGDNVTNSKREAKNLIQIELFINATMTSQFQVMHIIITKLLKMTFLNNRKVIKNKEKLRHYHSQEKPKRHD